MLTAADIAQVLDHYNLGTLHSTISAYRGFVNETAFVQTDTGKFVVRRNHRHQHEASLRYRHRLIAHLQEQQVPAPVIISTRDGDTLLELDNRFYEVMEFVQGEAFNREVPTQIMSVGATLARYHAAVKDFSAPPESEDLRYAPQSLLGLTEVLIRRDVMGDMVDTLNWYDGRAARLRKSLTDTKYRALPHLVIHGDIHRDNLLFAQNDVVALIDYDQIAWDTPVADLADALVAFASVDKPSATTWGVFNGPLDEERAALLIEGYASVARLSDEEIRALPVLLEVLWLKAEMGRVLSTMDGAPEYHLAVLDQGLALSYWLNERRDALVERWTDLMHRGGKSSRPKASAA